VANSASSRTVKVKFDGDATGLARAAKEGEKELDKFSKNTQTKFKENGEKSSRSFGAGMKKWFKGEGGGLFREIGKSGGTVFGSGLLGALKTPILGPAILAAATAVVATAAPAAGAIVAGGLVAGFGAGLAGLGIVFAAKNAEVKAAWTRTLTDMGGQMRVLSKPFETTLLAMTVVARRTFATFKPELDKAFKKIAPALTAFGDQLGRAFEGLAPAVAPLADAFAAVLRSLGPAMVSAVGRISKGLQDLADSVKKNPEALADMVRGVGEVSESLLGLVTNLNNANTSFSNITKGTSLVDVVFKGVAGQIRGADLAFRGITAPISLAEKGLQKLGLRGEEAVAETDTFSASLLAAATEAGKAAKPVETLAQKFERQAAATQKANTELFRQSNLLLTLSGSQISYEEALDSATESVKQNGKTLDIGTAAGRANKTALDNIATSANDVTESMRNAGDGNVKAAKHAEESRKAFVKHATQMGLSKKEAEKLAAKLIAIPNVSRTAKLTANKKDLETKLAAAKRELADPNITKTRKAELKAEISKLEAGVQRAKEALGEVPKSKTVTITTRYSVTGTKAAIAAGTRGGGKVFDGNRASGGPVQPRRTYLVGERGPEFITMGNSPGRVTSAEAGIAASGGGDTYVYVEIDGEQLQGRIVKTVKQNNRDLKRTVGAR
jgi:hypothetical protein